MLEKYNVVPIDYYNMIKQDDEKLNKIKIQASAMYGYYNKFGKLYKSIMKHKKK